MSMKWQRFMLDHIIEVLLLLVVLGMWMAHPNFMTSTNWFNILKSVALKGVIAFGMTMVIISAQIDLSVGSVVAISGVLTSYCCVKLPGLLGVGLTTACILGILASVLFAVLVGVFHGYSQHQFGMPAFIVTLSSMLFLYGLAGLICGGFPIANKLPKWFNIIGVGRVGPVPVPAIILIVVFLIAYFIMNYTNIGRSVYAVGGNEEAARLSGINVGMTKIFCFVATALLATLGGFMNSAQVLSASFSFGKGWETDVISSVVIGGTAMTGGIGRIGGTMLGIIFLGVIINGMTLLNVSVYMQFVIRGALLFFAVLLSIFLPKLKRRLG